MGNSLRIAKKPLEIPTGVEVKWQAPVLSVKGKHGQVEYQVDSSVHLSIETNQILVSPKSEVVKSALVSTTRVLLGNIIQGVHQLFQRKLLLVGVGFRAKCQGNVLELSLGFSHPVSYTAPEGIQIDVVNNTEILVKGIDKRLVGQVAADIRRFRPPDSYKGKGVRFAEEVIHLKETKKK